jgi:hypothetical protein
MLDLQLAFAMTDKGIYHRHRMARVINIIAALLCLICVLALCIAPSVDIPDTTLKSLQIAFLMMLILFAGVFQLAGMVDRVLLSHCFYVGAPCALVRSPLPPIQTNCVQQC